MQSHNDAKSEFLHYDATNYNWLITSLLYPISADDLSEFRKNLMPPISYKILIICLKEALVHQANSIINYLSTCQLSKADDNKACVTTELFNLIYLEHAEYFLSNQKNAVREQFLQKIHLAENKDLLLAVIAGDMRKIIAYGEIPEKPSNDLNTLIVYAAANDQAAVVRYLHEHHHNPHNTLINENALVSAIIQNATQVLDYLIQTEFDPNLALTGKLSNDEFSEDALSLLTLTVRYHRTNQFIQLIEKGATLTLNIFRLAMKLGHVDIIDYCQQSLYAKTIKSADQQLLSYMHNQNFRVDDFDDKGYNPLDCPVIDNLVGKGATLILNIFRLAITLGNDVIIYYCKQFLLTFAIKSGDQHLLSHFHDQGFSIDVFDNKGYNPLCYAAIYHQLDIAKQLVMLGADIMKVHSNGNHAILCAALANDANITKYLLEYLQEHLKDWEKRHLYYLLNKTDPNKYGKVPQKRSILFQITDPAVLRPNCSEEFAVKKYIIDLLIEHGATLTGYYENLTIAENGISGEQDFSYFYNNSNDQRIVYLNFLLSKVVIEANHLSLAQTTVIEKLISFYKNNEVIASYTPDLAALSRCRDHLQAWQECLHRLRPNFDEGLLEYFALLIITHPKSRDHLQAWQECLPRLRPNFGKGLLEYFALLIITHPKSAVSNLSDYMKIIFSFRLYDDYVCEKILLIIQACLTALPNCKFTFEIYKPIIKNLRLINAEYGKDLRRSMANLLENYSRYQFDHDPDLEYKFNLLDLRRETSCYSPAMIVPSEVQRSYLFSKLLHHAIKFNDTKLIKMLIESHFTNSQAVNICIWPIEDFKNFLTLSCTRSSLIADVIHHASPTMLNMINLRLLLVGNHSDSIHKYLGIVLQTLKNNNPRKLYIIAHILTYFSASMPQSAQVIKIFDKGLLELANIKANNTENLNSIVKQHYYKEILIAILTVRLALIKLLSTHFQDLENLISNLSLENDIKFLSDYQKTANLMEKGVKDHLTPHNLSLATHFLDQIEQEHVDLLKQALDKSSQSEINFTGKRLADGNIINSNLGSRQKLGD